MIFTFTPGYYNLAVTNSCGTTVDTAQVNFLPDISNVPIPNVLTPNGDGINDEYIIPILSEAISFRLDFFDRWGALLHTQTDINDWWKGTGQGDNIVPPGTYYVIISYFDCQNIETVKTEFISVFY
jgi:gliding motility-associated-like protein